MKSYSFISTLLAIFILNFFGISLTIEAQTGFDQHWRIAPIINNPINILSADFDNDGDRDIIVISYLNSPNKKVAIFENVEGVYAGIPMLTHHLNESGDINIQLADLDNDNYLDLVFAFKNLNKIAWSKNNGGFNFSDLQTITTAVNYLKFVEILDFDNDNDLDLLSASSYDHKIALYENLGDGNFGNQIVIAQNAYQTSVVTALDVDNDGLKDVISGASVIYGLAWHKNYGNGIFGVPQTITNAFFNPTQIAIADMNNDGIEDLIVNSGSKKYLILRDVTQSFVDPILIHSNGYSPFFLIDFNFDGNKDIIFPLNNNTVNILLNYGNAIFEGPVQLVNMTYPLSTFAVQDVDNNGYIDILITTNSTYSDRVEWYENQDNSTFVQHILAENNAILYDIFNSDLDNDGDIDVLSASYGDKKIAWFENLGNGTFNTIKVITRNAWGANTVFAADLDNDGFIDVLSSSYNDDKIAWYRNEGQGNFSEQILITNTAEGAMAVTAADFDNDGDADVVAAIYEEQLFRYANDGSGSFSLEQTFIVPIAIQKIRIADLNYDGFPDIIFAASQNEEAGIIGWIKNNGDGTFYPNYSTIAIVPGINDFDVGDIDNDGLPDVVGVSLFYDQSIWYRNNGEGFPFSEEIICTCLNEPVAVSAEDLDNDGDLDIIVGSIGNDRVEWYQNDGMGNFQAADFPISNLGNIRAILAADIDNDGYKDVVLGYNSYSIIDWHRNLFLNIASNTVYTDKIQQLQILQLSPNPTQNTITITYTTPDNQPLSLQMHDLAGKQAFTQTNLPASPGIHTVTLNMQHLTKGMYLLTLSSAKTALSEKILKE
ncbi:MAG: T9SS type A sorting domain-containing protein [Sphingobacteriales bacterium]|nr:MAG: T9SS type A sorting domain-containing protein [Sphingobacteriales bacterium]